MKESELDEMTAWIQRHIALVAGAGVLLVVLLFLRLRKPAPSAEPAAATDQTPHTVYNDTYNTYQQAPTPTPSGTPGGPVPAQRPPSGRPGGPVPAQRPPSGRPGGPVPAEHRSVTVKAWPDQDSTLSGIATHYGVSGGWMPIYQLDKSTIDTQAHQHGHYGDEYNWLFPGEVLALPN